MSNPSVSRRAIDLVLALALGAATFGTAVRFAPAGYQAGFTDMAHDGYQLRQVLDLSQGLVIFRDTFDQYGPLNGYVNAVGFLTMGRRLLSVKYFICAWYGAIAVLLFVMSRRWLDPWLAGFTVLVWLGVAPFYQHGIMVSPHVYVLLFQAIATIVALRSPDLSPRRFVVVGVLAAISWALKQSMGTLYLAAVLTYLVLRVLARSELWRSAARALMATAIGYGLVVVIVLGLLWTRGALRDWYLQTIVFPKTLYVGDGTSFLITFARLQLRQPIYWLAIRAVVVVGAATQFASRRDSDALLMASITAFLWIAAFPSANFMHQWWTVSLAIPPFVLYVHDTIGLIVKRRQPLTAVVTAALVSLLVVGAVRERLTEGDFRMAALSETIREPAVFRGIRTDAPTKRAFDLFYQMISRYESHHPGTAIVSINSEGRPDGIPIDESLVLLSFIEKNPHPLPVYWSVPVLTTTIYPEYYNVVWNEIRRQHPLIVEYRDAGYKPAAIKDYTVLIGAQADFGYWYLYAPEHTTRAEHEELSVFLARDGSLESGLSVSGADPTRTSGLDPNPVGASRGTVQTSNGPVTLYTWPADLPVKGSEFAIDPLPEPLGHTSIVKKTASGGWEVEGQAEGKYSYLIQFVDAPLERNATLVARGELYEGGFQMGFIRQNQWSGSVVVTEPGPFEAVLVIQKSAKYTVEIANCLQSTSSLSAARRHWLRGTLGAFTGDFLPNHFRISQLGWARLRN